MRMKVSNYIAKLLVQNGITDVFMITGGGAMHLDDGLGHEPGLHCVYNHHEQACAIAAESYARIHNRIAAVCVTTGPGGTNAITGVVGGWLDSIPMLVISGQVRYDVTARSTGLGIRAFGDQEYDICKSVVLRDRKHLAEDGVMIIVATIDRETGNVLAGPDIVSRGFVYVRESEALLDEAKQLMKQVMDNCRDRNIREWGNIKSAMRDALSDYIYSKTKRSPMILPIIMEVQGKAD